MARNFVVRAIAMLGVGWVVCLSGCDFSGNRRPMPLPRPGVVEMEQALMVPVPGGRVNAAGGNLFISRDDISVDTQIGNWTVGAVWNSATGVWRWNFESNLRGIIFTDESGAKFAFHYMVQDQAVPGTHWVRHGPDAIRTAGGLVYHHDELGAISSVNWISAQYPSLHFLHTNIDLPTRVTSIEQCTSATHCATLYSMTYDGYQRLTSVVDLAGRSVLYAYDLGSHRIASVRDPLDIANDWPGTRYEYDDDNRLSAIINSQGERIEYLYFGTTKAVMMAVQVAENERLWAFAYQGYDLQGNGLAKTTVVDPVGGVANYSFDIAFRMWRHRDAAGDLWLWKWRGTTKERIRTISPAGVAHNFGVVSDVVTTETLPTGNVITQTFAASPAENREDPYARAILRIEDNLGLIESRTYSVEGVLESVATGAGDVTTYALDPVGNMTITDPAGVVTAYTDRGDHGHYQTAARGAKTVHYSYDLVGNMLTADGLLDEDPNLSSLSIGQGGIVARSYDADRNISALMLEDGGAGAPGLQSELRMEWRADHQRTFIERPYGGDTQFIYNAVGQRIEERTLVDGAWMSTVIERDANGRVTAILRPNGMASRVTYRGTGELNSIQSERDWTNPAEVDGVVDLIYHHGLLIELQDTAHAMLPESYSYDVSGLLDAVHFPDGEVITLVRDLRGRISMKEYWRPGSSLLRTFEYDYDLADRPTEVREDGVAILALTYASGHNVESLYGNGVKVVSDYDPVTGAFAGFAATNAAQQLVATMDVATTTCGILLPVGRCLTERTDSMLGVISTSYAEYQLEDQASERLIADSHGMSLPVDGFYDYDELSNLQQSALGTFIYNAEHNRLLTIEAGGTPIVDYVYDEAGFVIARDGIPVTWNGMGRVTSVGNDVTLQWDTFGRKIASTVVGQAGVGEETRWKYGGELTEDEFGSNQELDLGWAVSRLDDSSHEYRLFDFRGNSKLLLDDAAEVAAHHHYTGYERVAVDGVDESDLGFAGGSHAGELVLIGKRIYDPVAGRFLSTDPIFQTINPYSYTLGNPVRFWDPGGDQVHVKVGGSVELNVGIASGEFHIEVETDFPGAAESGDKACGCGGGGNGSGSGGGDGGEGSNSNGGSSGSPGGGEGSGGGLGGGGGSVGGGFSFCGLGFEAAPLLLIWWVLRKRRGTTNRMASVRRSIAPVTRS